MKKRIISSILSVIICSSVSICFGFFQVSAATAPTATIVELDPQKITMDCAPSANIMKDANWNFESGEDYWNLVNTIDNMGSAYFYVMSITDEKPHSGTYSLQLDGVGGWSNIMVPFNVKKNTNYNFTMWVNASPGLGGSTGSVFKLGQVTSHDITKIPAQDWFSGNLGFTFDGNWHQIGITVNSGDNDELALVIADGGGKLYFDEMRFFETANPNGTAATEPSNLQKVKDEYKRRADEAKASSSKSSSSKASSSKSSSTNESSSINSTNNSDSESSATSSDSSIKDSSSSSSQIPVKSQNNTLVFILIGIIILLIGGGFATWYFKFRK